MLTLRVAVSDLSLLISRGYSIVAALKLVGDRYQLAQRQRIAVRRAACSDEALARRVLSCVKIGALHDRVLAIDGYNVLTTLEAALAGGFIVRCRDGCYRDMASMHGTYRFMHESDQALDLIAQALKLVGIKRSVWYLDKPVSNSGLLGVFLRERAPLLSQEWDVKVVYNPDQALSEGLEIVASSDSQVLDMCRAWWNLARFAIERFVPEAKIVDLS